MAEIGIDGRAGPLDHVVAGQVGCDHRRAGQQCQLVGRRAVVAADLQDPALRGVRRPSRPRTSRPRRRPWRLSPRDRSNPWSVGGSAAATGSTIDLQPGFRRSRRLGIERMADAVADRRIRVRRCRVSTPGVGAPRLEVSLDERPQPRLVETQMDRRADRPLPHQACAGRTWRRFRRLRPRIASTILSLALAGAEVVLDERPTGRRVRRLRVIERRAQVGDPRDRPGDAGGDVAEEVAARLDPGDEVVRPGHDRVGQDRRVEAEVGIRGAQQPVEVDVADDADRRRRVAAGPRKTVEEIAVRALVALARVLLDDDVDVRQRPAETGLEHVRQVRSTDERRVHGRHDEHPVALGDAEFGADRQRVPPPDRSDSLVSAVGARVEVEPWRPGDDHLAPVVGTRLQDASLVLAEDEGARRHDRAAGRVDRGIRGGSRRGPRAGARRSARPPEPQPSAMAFGGPPATSAARPAPAPRSAARPARAGGPRRR